MPNYNVSQLSSISAPRSARIIVPLTSARTVRDPRLTNTVAAVPTTGHIWPRQKAQS